VVHFDVSRPLLPDKRRPKVAVLLSGISNCTTYLLSWKFDHFPSLAYVGTGSSYLIPYAWSSSTMPPQNPHRQLVSAQQSLRGVWIGVAAALIAWGAQTDAHAACGDYLAMSGAEHTAITLDQDTERSTSGSESPLKLPCHGPQCQRSPAAPPPPLPVQIDSSQHEQAHMQRLSNRCNPSPLWWIAFETTAKLSSGFPVRLERPPRV